jgi:hypothetical protein
MNPCFLLGNPEQTPLAGGARVGVAHRRRKEAWRQTVRTLEAVLSGTIIRGTLKAPNSQLVTLINTKLQRPDGCD